MRRGPPPALIGRSGEQARLDGLLDAARSGQSGALVIRGEPGVGKTCLLDYAVSAAAGPSPYRSRQAFTQRRSVPS